MECAVGYHMGPNRVRLRMKRGTRPMTHLFWFYGTDGSSPNNITTSISYPNSQNISIDINKNKNDDSDDDIFNQLTNISNKEEFEVYFSESLLNKSVSILFLS